MFFRSVQCHRAFLLYIQGKSWENGVEEVLGLVPLSGYEKKGFEALKQELLSSIEKVIKFASENWKNKIMI